MAVLNDVAVFGSNVDAVLIIMADLTGIRKDAVPEIPFFQLITIQLIAFKIQLLYLKLDITLIIHVNALFWCSIP